MAQPNMNQTGVEFPVTDLIGEETAVAPNTDMLPDQSVDNVNAADAPIWSAEEPVSDIITQSDADLIPQIEKEVMRAEAVVLLTNLADKQSEEVLADITTKVLEGYKTDLASRKEWEELNEQIIDLAKLLVKKKTYNGEVVANVKYPLIINACIQFAARAYPEIIKGNEVVRGKVIGADPDNAKFERAQRISEFMSFQLLNDMEDWEEGVDQMLFTLPAIGCVFKKSYFNSLDRRNISETVFADDLVVNYFAESLERAPRLTHKIYLYHNEVVERITAGVFMQFDVAELGQAVSDKTSDIDDETPHLFLEQHRWYDLDNDGYQEPYIVTVHEQTQKLVRIAPRFASDGIIRKDDTDAIIKIVPEQYFTRYLFMPAIDGGFYGMGFGSLLMSSNAAINTLINQLLDAGTNSNRQAGFLGRGLKLGRGKTMQLKSGEWKYVEATGDDLRKNVFPMPVREPSGVLFQLLGMMIDSGKELAGMTEILAGKSPGANVPAESVLALIEQGLQVYSAVHKRIHRAQYKEFTKIRRLNALYMDQMTYSTVLDEQAVVQEDFFNEDFDIVPVSDPNNTTMMQRVLKAKAMLELRGQGLNDMEITRRYLQAMDINDIDAIMPDEKAEGQTQEEQLTIQKMQAEMSELNEKIEKLKSETALNYAKRDSEYYNQDKTTAGIDNDDRKIAIEGASVMNQIQLGRNQKSVGKAPAGITNATAKREYGLESNNQTEQK